MDGDDVEPLNAQELKQLKDCDFPHCKSSLYLSVHSTANWLRKVDRLHLWSSRWFMHEGQAGKFEAQLLNVCLAGVATGGFDSIARR